MEKPVTSIIQEQLDKLDVEAMIEERLASMATATEEPPLSEPSEDESINNI